jgi:UDP-N-acetylmuramate--alanine ligase
VREYWSWQANLVPRASIKGKLCLTWRLVVHKPSMHVYFSGIGGVGIGPLALIARQAGYEVSGSDLQDGQYIQYLRTQGINNIHIGQTREQIAEMHIKKPIDWFVYSSALPKTNPHHPELLFCQENGIKTSKRDELLNKIIEEKKLKLIAIAGTHGKTTTTAMAVWLLKQLGLPVSYSVGAKISFGDMGAYDPKSEYFVYECDEFDRNFLAFHPYLAIIAGVAYDHHEIFPTEENYQTAFRDFINQSEWTVAWEEDSKKLTLPANAKHAIESYDDPGIDKITVAGLYNRRDAWLVIKSINYLTKEPIDRLVGLMNGFPGVARRFEKIIDGLYSDDAHTPEKILGCMSVARELAGRTNQKIVVIYEPLTNRRMHYLGAAHHSVFDGASNIYWVPSYLAREDPTLAILPPEELIKHLSPELQQIAKPLEKNNELKSLIEKHIQAGDMVVAMAGGGAGSLDEWLRKEFIASKT